MPTHTQAERRKRRRRKQPQSFSFDDPRVLDLSPSTLRVARRRKQATDQQVQPARPVVTAATASTNGATQIPALAPNDNFLQLTPANQGEVERRIQSRARNRRHTVAQTLANSNSRPTDPFAVAVNDVLIGKVAPFNAAPEIQRAAIRAAGGPLALGQRFAQSNQRRRLEGVAADNPALEVQGGSLRPTQAIQDQARADLGDPQGVPLTAEEVKKRRKAGRERRNAQDARLLRRRQALLTGQPLGLIEGAQENVNAQDILFEGNRERRAANVEAGGSVGRLRRQRSTDVERSRQLGVLETEAQAKVVAAAQGDPRVTAAGLRSSDPAVSQAFAKKVLGVLGGTGAAATNDDPDALRAAKLVKAARLQAIADADAELSRSMSELEQIIVAEMSDVSVLLSQLGVIGVGDANQAVPLIERKVAQIIDSIKGLDGGKERDELIDSMLLSLRNTVKATTGPIDELFGAIGGDRSQSQQAGSKFGLSQVTAERTIRQQLEALKTTEPAKSK